MCPFKVNEYELNYKSPPKRIFDLFLQAITEVTDSNRIIIESLGI